MGQTFADRVLALVRAEPGLTDRELTTRLLGRDKHPAPVNQDCRLLESRGLLVRERRIDNLIRNYPVRHAEPQVARPIPAPTPPEAPTEETLLSEDDVKRLLEAWLRADGWTAEVAWGKAPGIDIVARRGVETWIIEAKGAGSLPAMRVNYFLGMLGETLQRMSRADARYSIALPDMQQFRRLWQRLPDLAKHRTGISALFVAPDGTVDHVGQVAEPGNRPGRGSSSLDKAPPRFYILGRFLDWWCSHGPQPKRPRD